MLSMVVAISVLRVAIWSLFSVMPLLLGLGEPHRHERLKRAGDAPRTLFAGASREFLSVCRDQAAGRGESHGIDAARVAGTGRGSRRCGRRLSGDGGAWARHSDARRRGEFRASAIEWKRTVR